MTTTKSPPLDPIAKITKDSVGNTRMDTVVAWRIWFEDLKTTAKDNIADASTSHSVSSWATTNNALDSLATKINSILDILESINAMEE